MSVIDALGTEAKVGDEVLFGQASKGAQELVQGVVVKINDKTVSIKYSYTKKQYAGYDDNGYIYNDVTLVTTAPRKSKCFVITSYE